MAKAKQKHNQGTNEDTVQKESEPSLMSRH